MLKNAGATYQRLMNHMFRPQIGQNVEVYVDDMLVKSHDERKHVDDLEETFDTLRQYNMKLNPNKCAFGVSLGNSLVSWFHIGELRQIPIRSKQSWIWTKEYQRSPVSY